MKWLEDNGAIFPKIKYPAVFSSPDGGINLNGVLASQDIKPRDVVCYIPNKVLISTESARNSEIGEIFRNNDEMFVAN